ncbi:MULTISPECIES: BrxE family protein [Sorangium]|uniref:BrxE family protein n=1 Tax=Sorangium cellulosum TaxID=56 RepID=A0A4P2QJG7_SORCE|nr:MULTISPECIES: BrxE family protein [Sorangium]AUX29563.1 uncharacterized protein SOCE836_016540 [Sorangium cellulosum]WCQ88959.1 hypothetical protein NQZ70_01642 [Sorangium sp. Soce836]
MTGATLDLDRLLKLRLLVARFGEMDVAKWWNTKGQLGRLGSAALRRGFPRTHRFAQARCAVQPCFGAGIETEEQFDAALAGLRDERARLIGAGKKVVLS